MNIKIKYNLKTKLKWSRHSNVYGFGTAKTSRGGSVTMKANFSITASVRS